MAALSFSMPQEIIEQLNRAGNTAEYAPKMIEAEEDVVYPEVIRNLEQHRESGELIEHVKKTKPKLDKSGVWRGQIRPSGKDYKGVSNNEKLLSLEYGNSKQAATPIMRPAKETKADETQKAAQTVFNEAISK